MTAPTPPPVVPGAVHRLAIGARDDHGRGTSALGRRPVRVPNALPGEVVDARLEHVGRHLAVARVLHVVTPAAERRPDTCPLGTTCPGCGLRTTAHAARLAWKRARVVEALAAAGLADVAVAPTVPSPEGDRWRHKAYLTARRTSDGIRLGLFAEGTHRLVTIDGCLAHAGHVEATLAGVRRALAATDPPVYDERSRRGWLRAVAVRGAADGRSALVTLVVVDRGHDGARALGEAILKEARLAVGVVLNVHPEPSNAPYGPTFVPLVGRADLDETSGPFRLRVSAGSFFQVNPAIGAAMADALAAEAATAPPGPALDLYGGVGVTALRLRAQGRTVTLVEMPGSASADARVNLASDGEARAGAGSPPPARVVEGRVEDVLPSLPLAGASVVVVNPPRSGLAPSVAGALADARPPCLLYVSCDPRTLARDLAVWRRAGLELRGVTPYDLMPQTPHVEALAVVRRPD